MQLFVKVKRFGNKPWLSKYCVPHAAYTPSVGCVTIHYCTLPSGWLDCHSACCSLWPWGPSSRAVWDLWGRLPAQEEGEGLADCKWQWMKWQSVPVVYSFMCVWHTEWHDMMSFDVVVSGHYAYTKTFMAYCTHYWFVCKTESDMRTETFSCSLCEESSCDCSQDLCHLGRVDHSFNLASSFSSWYILLCVWLLSPFTRCPSTLVCVVS